MAENPQTPTERVLAALRSAGSDVKKIDGQWAAQCPSHNDRMPSLTVREGRDSRALLHCHAGCDTRDILDAIGMQQVDLFPDSDPRPEPIAWRGYLEAMRELDAPKAATTRAAKPLPENLTRSKVAHYDYTDADGTLVARVVKYLLVDTDTGEAVGKTFTQQAVDPDGGFKRGLDGLTPPLYRLPDVLAAVAAGQPVFVVEGEKDADTARDRLGVVATTCAMGAGAWKPEHTAALAGATVVIVGDDDTAGRKHSAHVAEQLRNAGSTVHVLRPAAGKDLTDHVDAGLGIADLVHLEDRGTEPDVERTSWWPRDLTGALTGTDTEPEPEFLARDDGHRLLYAGKVNGLIGESESGKTWVALLAVLQALQVDRPVLYLDFEDTPTGIVGRLRAMGATDAHLSHLSYIGPDEALGIAQRADLAEALVQLEPALIVLDGFNAAMTVMGLDLMSNSDATRFAQQLLRPLSSTGAAVLYVDHVPKNSDQRGKGGIGAQAKRAMTTGCALLVEVAQPFGRGMTGRLKLTVDKDRPGHVRAFAAFAKSAGIVELDSSDTTGSVTVRIQGPDLRPASERPAFRPTGLMEKVSAFLAMLPTGASKNAIEEHIGGTRDYVRIALATLVDEGYVELKSGARGAIIHHLARPYHEANDLVGEVDQSAI